MDWVLRFLWAVAMAALAWVICMFVGGEVATTSQPQLNFLGRFLVDNANLVAVIVFLIAFVGGAPGPLLARFRQAPPR